MTYLWIGILIGSAAMLLLGGAVAGIWWLRRLAVMVSYCSEQLRSVGADLSRAHGNMATLIEAHNQGMQRVTELQEAVAAVREDELRRRRAAAN